MNNHNQKLNNWKILVKKQRTLLVGIDISKDYSDACIGFRDEIIQKNLHFNNNLSGFQKLVETVTLIMKQKKSKFVIIGLEPTSVYWQPLYYFLIDKKFAVVTIDSRVAYHNRKTMNFDQSKSDKKDAVTIFDLVGQQKFVLQSTDSPKMQLYRHLVANWTRLKSATTADKNRLKANLFKVFPEYEKVIDNVDTQKSINFLYRYPVPSLISHLSLKQFIEKASSCKPKMNIQDLNRLYLAARSTVAIKCSNEDQIKNIIDVYRLNQEIEYNWWQMCLEKAKENKHYETLKGVKGLGERIATGIILSVGDFNRFSNAKQITKYAGLNVIERTSGSSIRLPSHISKRGSKQLRYWAYEGALQVIKYHDDFRKFYLRRKNNSKGKGKKALVAVSDKLLRVLWAITTKGVKLKSKIIKLKKSK